MGPKKSTKMNKLKQGWGILALCDITKGCLPELNVIARLSRKARKLTFQSEEVDADVPVLTDTTRNPRPGEEDGKGKALLVHVVSCPPHTEPPPDTNARPKTTCNVCFTPFHVTNPSHPVKSGPQHFLLPSDLHKWFFFFSPVLIIPLPDITGVNLFLCAFFVVVVFLHRAEQAPLPSGGYITARSSRLFLWGLRNVNLIFVSKRIRNCR